MAARIVYLRASPAPGVGGEYAVNNGIDQIITIAAQRPPFIDRQKWFIVPVDEAEDTVVIRPLEVGNEARWGFVGEHPVPEAPLIVVPNEERQVVWKLQRIENGKPNAYTLLRVQPPIVGAAWYAGTNERNEVIFTVLPIEAPDAEKPYWVLYDVNE